MYGLAANQHCLYVIIILNVYKDTMYKKRSKVARKLIQVVHPLLSNFEFLDLLLNQIKKGLNVSKNFQLPSRSHIL